MKLLQTLAAASVLAVTMGFTGSAQAAGCYYKVYNLRGNFVLQAYGHAIKKKHACNRARRQCNRKLQRAFNRGRIKPARGIRCKRAG